MTGCSEDLDIKEIKLTRQEKSELKEYLYETLKFLATERPEFYPRKKDSFETLLSSYFYWAEEYNDNYFPEIDDFEIDKISKYLAFRFNKSHD